jgi:hypothetical protein
MEKRFSDEKILEKKKFNKRFLKKTSESLQRRDILVAICRLSVLFKYRPLYLCGMVTYR